MSLRLLSSFRSDGSGHEVLFNSEGTLDLLVHVDSIGLKRSVTTG